MDEKQGYGEFKWSSGNVYRGAYKNDLRNGYGEMFWTDGSIYKGNWVNGIQHGLGKMLFIDGTVNEGIFEHNIFKGPNGNKNDEITEESLVISTPTPEKKRNPKMKKPKNSISNKKNKHDEQYRGRQITLFAKKNYTFWHKFFDL